MTARMHPLGTRLAALGGGAVLALLLSGRGAGGLLAWAWDKVGITVLALLPLAIWAVWTAVAAARHQDLTLAYIGATAQRVGLLGTVIGIVMATIRIGDSLGNGAAGAVSGALPAVGQALVSTAVGFCIALVCDFFRYLGQRHAPAEAPDA